MNASRPGGPNRERAFGISVGTVLCLIALALAWRGRTVRAEWLGAIGAGLVVFGYLRPSLLRYPSDVWWKLATVLGWINARVLLTVLFLVLLTPVRPDLAAHRQGSAHTAPARLARMGSDAGALSQSTPFRSDVLRAP